MSQRGFVVQQGGWDKFTKKGLFNIQQSYDLLSLTQLKVQWKSVILNIPASQNSKFIVLNHSLVGISYNI